MCFLRLLLFSRENRDYTRGKILHKPSFPFGTLSGYAGQSVFNYHVCDFENHMRDFGRFARDFHSDIVAAGRRLVAAPRLAGHATALTHLPAAAGFVHILYTPGFSLASNSCVYERLDNGPRNACVSEMKGSIQTSHTWLIRATLENSLF